ncbi:TAP42-like_family protein [Hexamita inflata]|uniref:TAP42-like_family protein n=1 Tax=Hexamita inflata TaxID=28002 RepID=A0ABP1HGP1_9EUKA
MDLFESARIQYDILKTIPEEERAVVLPIVMSQFEAIIELGEQSGVFSTNETIQDLNEESIPFALARFYLAQLISNYIMQKEKRLQAVKLASLHFSTFIDILLQYQLLSDQEIQLHNGKLNPTQQRDLKRQLLQEENKARIAAQQANLELTTKGGKMELEACYKALLIFAKYQVVRELKYLDEEQQLLEFEAADPDAARRAAEDFTLQSNSLQKPKLVQLTPQDVDRVVKNKRFVPLDEVELMKQEEAKQSANRGEQKVRQTAGQINQEIDFKNVDLVYGGGNPYTFSQKGEQGDHRDYSYNVVKTDTFYPGQPKEEQIDEEQAFKMEAAGRDEVMEEDFDVNSQREQDDWNDENPKGYGNKPRLV